MTLMSNCGHDEYYRYSGGAAGDQTGDEWVLMPWCDYGQDAIYRYPDPEIRQMIADYARAAANNDYIGYDQWERTTFWQALCESGYDPAQVTMPCECDCSSGVAAIVKAIGYRLGIDDLKQVSEWMTTYCEDEILTAAGFIGLYEDEYTRTDIHLIPGDIVCRRDQHTNIVVEGDGVVSDYDADIAYMQRQLNIQLVRRGWDQIDADGSYGPITAATVVSICQDWMLNACDPTVLINGAFYEGWNAALKLHPIRQGMANAAVMAVKAALIGKGYKGPALDINAWEFTPELTAIVKQFQADYGLTETGRVDVDTLYNMTHFDY